MTGTSLWLSLAGPVLLVLMSMMPGANKTPRSFALKAIAASLFALGTALATLVAVFLHGTVYTPVIGINGGGLSLYADRLTGMMLVLVSFVCVIVIGYSRNYLDGDARHGVFIQRLCFTSASVMLVVLAGNLVLLVVAWLATSYGLHKLLLFYAERRAANLAAAKKFFVSRVGDVCLIAASALLYIQYGALDYVSLKAAATSPQISDAVPNALSVAAVLIAITALLRSAQLPFHGWLLEVMETPTPVSALLHAGIINAGGFLILRLADIVIVSNQALNILALVGAATAIFASLVMLTQTSIKVSLAYSTIAQMGFMMLQCGLGAFSSAFLHILGHSLYKAHAFLSSGSVMDVFRASWTLSKHDQPHPARLLFALGVVLTTGFAIAMMFGVSFTEKPGVIVLVAITLMGLTVLLANGIDAKPNLIVTLRLTLAAALLAGLSFGLQHAAELILAGSLPTVQPPPGMFGLILAVLVLFAFGGVVILQTELARHSQTSFWQAFYVHLANGFYLNTLANRIAIKVWPGASSTTRPRNHS